VAPNLKNIRKLKFRTLTLYFIEFLNKKIT